MRINIGLVVHGVELAPVVRSKFSKKIVADNNNLVFKKTKRPF